jgi:hypothetical protein
VRVDREGQWDPGAQYLKTASGEKEQTLKKTVRDPREESGEEGMHTVVGAKDGMDLTEGLDFSYSMSRTWETFVALLE